MAESRERPAPMSSKTASRGERSDERFQPFPRGVYGNLNSLKNGQSASGSKN
jgi:hypothetical protein